MTIWLVHNVVNAVYTIHIFNMIHRMDYRFRVIITHQILRDIVGPNCTCHGRIHTALWRSDPDHLTLSRQNLPLAWNSCKNIRTENDVNKFYWRRVVYGDTGHGHVTVVIHYILLTSQLHPWTDVPPFQNVLLCQHTLLLRRDSAQPPVVYWREQTLEDL